jgi:DNA processing protein
VESGGRRALNLAEDPEELRALLLLRLLPGAGDRRIARVLREHGSARRALTLARKDFTRALGSAAFRARSDAALREQVGAALRRCRAIGALAVGLGSERYPKSLLALVDPPGVLFLRGDLALLDRPAIAIVGARRATPIGRRTAERIAAELSEHGVTVVSGLALGIDGAAHRGALSGPGGTIAVLGCGPDRAYPATNRGLFEEILERGLVVTEFFPGEAARPYNFPRRNRILAGLSAGVVVVEAAERSGALITVDHALDLGIEVFSVPGSVEAAQSKGSNHLLRDGAHLVTSGGDVLDIMEWPRMSPPASGGAEARPGSELSRVSRVLGPAPQPIHDIVPAVGLPVQTVLASLTRLEIEGRAVRGPDGWRARGYPR